MATGHTGHTGITGRKGLQGTPYGAPGTTFYSTSGRVNVTPVLTRDQGDNTIVLTNAGGVYTILNDMGVNNPQFIFPSTLTSDQYGTFWTITNGYTTGFSININSGIFKLTVPGTVITCLQGVGETNFIRMSLNAGQSITFVFFAGSTTTAEYIAF